MTWNGAGVYSLPALYFPEAPGNLVDSNRYNGVLNDVATGLNLSLTKDGQNVPTANLSMGGFKHTSVAAATAGGQYLVYGQSNALLVSLTVSGTLTFGSLGNFTVTNAAAPTITLASSGGDRGFWRYTEASSLMDLDSDGALALRAANTEFVRLTAAGNLGVGTPTPAAKLDVLTTSNEVVKFRNSVSSAAAAAIFRFQGNAATGLNAIVYSGAYASGSIFTVGPSGAALYSDSGAPFGIGTGDAQDFRLGTNGSTRLTLSAAGAATFTGAVTAVSFSGNFTGPLTGAVTGDVTGNVSGNAGTATLAATATNALACSGNAASATTAADCTGNSATATLAATATNALACSGNSATATALQTSRNINGIAFNGTADITITADAPTANYGRYTPAVSNQVNVASTSISANAGLWQRVGNIVTVSIGFSVAPTSAAPTLTSFSLTLPVASNLSGRFLSGTVNITNSGDTGFAVLGNNSNPGLANVSFTASSSAGVSRNIAVVFQYEVI